MRFRQYSIFAKSRSRCSRGARLAAGLIVLGLAGGGVTLWLSGRGHIDLGFWLGVCGFKQRFGLPCPGCGWTHAGQAFLTGHPIRAFMIQPAAAFFCAGGALTGIFALLVAVFGIEFGFLRRLYAAVGIKTLVLCAVIVLFGGWAVTLLRAILQGDGI
jgi:hypothetical protein